MSELISVIIPVYKVEDYLDACVSSAVNQTYGNLEIILVDDGSPDRCGSLCDAWAAKDSRITVIHQENGGLSDARNAGIRICRGDYISFVDSDDFISPDMIEKLHQGIKDGHSDIAECDYSPFFSAVPETGERKPGMTRTYSAEEALELLLDGSVFKYPVWNKLYDRKLFDGLMFEKGKLHEDVFFTYQAFGKAERAAKIGETLYYYRQREGSIMGTEFSERNLDSLEARQKQYEYMKANYPRLSQKALKQLLFSCLYFGQVFLRGSRKQRTAAEKAGEIFREYSRELDGSSLPVKQRAWFRLARISFKSCCIIRNILGIGV